MSATVSVIAPIASARWLPDEMRRRAQDGKRDSSIPPCSDPQFAKICQFMDTAGMSTMNISLPDTLRSFVDEQVSQRGYGTSSEYVRELIRRDQDRSQLRSMLLAGGASAPGAPADASYFEGLRARVRKTTKSGARG